MNRASQTLRSLALTVAVLLLWCHGLDATFHEHLRAAQAHAAPFATTTIATAVPAHPEAPVMSCCFGSGSASLLAVSPSAAPTLPLPLLAALLTPLLALAALSRRRSAGRALAPPRNSLVAQFVLIRI